MKPTGQRRKEWYPELFNLQGKRRHGEANAESSKGSSKQTSENRVIHLGQKGMESGYPSELMGGQADETIPGLQMAPKAPKYLRYGTW